MANGSVAYKLGELTAAIKGVHADVTEVKKDVKKFNEFQVKTEERLTNGNKKFEEYGNKIESYDKKIENYDKKVRRMPRGSVVYTLIVVGIALLSFLVAHYN